MNIHSEILDHEAAKSLEIDDALLAGTPTPSSVELSRSSAPVRSLVLNSEAISRYSMTSVTTRKRGLMACDFCRHRKRRCDGAKPCRTCAENKQQCNYPDLPVERIPGSSPNACDPRMSQYIMDAEEHRMQFLQFKEDVQQWQRQMEHNLRFNSVVLDNGYPGPAAAQSPISVKSYPASTSSAMGGEQAPIFDNTQFFIPHEHTTSTNWLLALPQFRNLLPVPTGAYFHAVEMENELPPELSYNNRAYATRYDIKREEATTLIENYFQYSNLFYPVLSLTDRQELDPKLSPTNDHRNESLPPLPPLESAIRLLVCALGKIAPLNMPTSRGQDTIALQIFASAMHIVNDHQAWLFSYPVKLAKALVLAASFLAHMGRPLHSWKHAQNAFSILKENLSLEVQRCLDTPRGLTDASDEVDRKLDQMIDDDQRRIYWSCLLIECDRIAELELHRSGVERWFERFPRPSPYHQFDDIETLGFNSETSIRVILNSIHNGLYAKNPNTSSRIEKYKATTDNLAVNLQEWWKHLPANVKPPLGTDVTPNLNDRARILRIRYYAARHIIYRPYVLHVAKMKDEHYRPESLELATECVDACINYLRNSTEMQRKRSPYLWTFSISSIGALLVLSVANSAPLLRPRVAPHLPGLQQLVIDRLSAWNTPGSSFEHAIRIIEAIRQQEQRSPS